MATKHDTLAVGIEPLRNHGATTLCDIDEQTLQHWLVQADSARSYSDRMTMVGRLEQVPPDSRAIAIFLSLIQDSEAAIRICAVEVLRRRLEIARRLLEGLIVILRTAEMPVRSAVCQVLAEIGPDAIAALDVLERLEPKNEAIVRAIWRIGGNIESVKPALIQLLASKHEEVSDLIYEIGAAASFAVPWLIPALFNDDADLRWASVDALGAIGPEARQAIPELVRLLGDSSGVVAGRAAHALAQIGPESVPFLIGELNKRDSRAREFAADALGQMGSTAIRAVPPLRACARDVDPELADWSSIAIAEITANREFLETLQEIVKQTQNGYKRQRAADAIRKIGQE